MSSPPQARNYDEEDMILEWVMDGSYSSEESKRIRWSDDGDMVVYDLDEAETTSPGDIVQATPQQREIHGLKRGGGKNPPGSFLVSKKNDKILSAGFIFQRGGEHRGAVGKTSGQYCPYHLKIDQGKHFLCICQCAHLPDNLIFT